MMAMAWYSLDWGDLMGQSRNENILENILGADNEILEPVSRIETLLIQLLEQLNEMHIEASENNGVVTLSVR